MIGEVGGVGMRGPENFKLHSNLRFLTPRWQDDAPIKVKFGMEERIIGSVLRATESIVHRVHCTTDNEITLVSDLESDRLCRLHTLELRGNRLTSISGLRLWSLKNLYLVSLVH